MKLPREANRPALPPEILELARMLADQARDRHATAVASNPGERATVPADR
jgi:hypothetical protein